MAQEYAVDTQVTEEPSAKKLVAGAKRKKGYAGRIPMQDDPRLQEVEEYIAQNLMDIVKAMVERAKNGDNVAAKYLIDRKLGKPVKLTVEDLEDQQAFLEEVVNEMPDDVDENDLDTACSDLPAIENGMVQPQNTKLSQAEFLQRMRNRERRRKLARRK